MLCSCSACSLPFVETNPLTRLSSPPSLLPPPSLPGSYSITYLSLFFDAVGVGHHAWAVFYATRQLCCKSIMSGAKEAAKPEILRVHSAELLAATGSPLGAGAGKGKAGQKPLAIAGAGKV